MDFEQSFSNWLTGALDRGLPLDVAALFFNLYEPAFVEGVKFGIEIVGADRFDEQDPDWACDEVWEPAERGLFIPAEYSGDTWEECLAKMSRLVGRHLAESSQNSAVLKSKQAIAIGFVDGDLQVLWRRE